jgi:hypothetical protein
MISRSFITLRAKRRWPSCLRCGTTLAGRLEAVRSGGELEVEVFRSLPIANQEPPAPNRPADSTVAPGAMQPTSPSCCRCRCAMSLCARHDPQPPSLCAGARERKRARPNERRFYKQSTPLEAATLTRAGADTELEPQSDPQLQRREVLRSARLSPDAET